MSRHHHELCNGVVNFENISVQLPSYPQVSSIQFLDSLDKKNICGLSYGNFIVMEDEKMLLSSGIYQKYFSDKQNNKQKKPKKKKPNILNNGNISLITWKAEWNVLFDDKISSNTNHLSLIQWHCRILATSNILNNAISSANVTLQKMWTLCLSRASTTREL